MDVGADNFHFNLEDTNGRKLPTQAYRQAATTELHVDSLDRYLPNMLQTTAFFQNYPNQNLAKLAGPILLNSTAPTSGTNALIQTSRPLTYGYYSRVALTQMFLNLKMPTIIAGYNNTLAIEVGTTPTATTQFFVISIPPNYYDPASLVVVLQGTIRAANAILANMTVAYDNVTKNSFTFTLNNPAYYMSFFFGTGAGTSEATQIQIGRTARMLGLNRACFGFSPDANTTGQPAGNNILWQQATGGPANFLPTDYVDIVSASLTNFKDAKDGNTSLASPGAVMGRIWLIESTFNDPSNPQSLTNIGIEPIVVMKNWSNPNWCQWSPNQTINSIDIKLLDMWGEVIPWSSTNPTEWSATLTLTE